MLSKCHLHHWRVVFLHSLNEAKTSAQVIFVSFYLFPSQQVMHELLIRTNPALHGRLVSHRSPMHVRVVFDCRVRFYACFPCSKAFVSSQSCRILFALNEALSCSVYSHVCTSFHLTAPTFLLFSSHLLVIACFAIRRFPAVSPLPSNGFIGSLHKLRNLQFKHDMSYHFAAHGKHHSCLQCMFMSSWHSPSRNCSVLIFLRHKVPNT